MLAESAPDHSHRHEDHVGHKVLAVNNTYVIGGDNGISFFPTTVYTDVYGGNVSTTPFPGSIKQYFSGDTSGVQLYLRGATRDYGANPADGVRAPN